MADFKREGEYLKACPIAAALQVLGDRWSLTLVRDMMFDQRRTFGELLRHSHEGIASNILDARLKHLEAAEVIRRVPHPLDRRKNLFQLRPAGIDLLPVLSALGRWGATYVQAGPERYARILDLEHGGPQFMKAFMHELAAKHLRPPRFQGYLKLAPQAGPNALALSFAAETADPPRTD
jgi:DNA-binding HxlR family transcriptional regulator